MGIVKNNWQKKNLTFYVKKNTSNIPTLKKVYSYTYYIFLLHKAINTFYNLYYDYRDIITMFRPGSYKWNTPFINF